MGGEFDIAGRAATYLMPINKMNEYGAQLKVATLIAGVCNCKLLYSVFSPGRHCFETSSDEIN